jgi:putative FmdB family regulatory protein
VPTYQYACTSCGEQIEAVQRFTDDPLSVCPACGGGLRKVFLPVGIVFKGSGFYRTDSRNGSVADGDKDKGDKDKGDKDKDKDKSAAKVNGSGDGKAADGKAAASGTSSSTGSKKTADKKPAGAGSAP